MSYIKNFFRILLAAALLLTVAPQDAAAQLTKKQQRQLQKERNKQYKSKIKEYKKGKWQLGASSRTIEVALLEHYAKLAEDDNNVEFIGEVSQCQSINVCRQFALNNAVNRYATLASGNVKGRIESMLRADANLPQVEIDKFIAGYENLVQAEVGSVLTESYSIVRETPATRGAPATREYKTFFILNEEKAGAARMRAMERSLRETQIAVREAEEISRFVNEGFKVD